MPHVAQNWKNWDVSLLNWPVTSHRTPLILTGSDGSMASDGGSAEISHVQKILRSAIWGLVGLVCATSSATALDRSALRAPPSTHTSAGPCVPHLGTPYLHAVERLKRPMLFYANNRLSVIVVAVKADSMKEGGAAQLLEDFGGLPIASVSMVFADGNILRQTTGR